MLFRIKLSPLIGAPQDCCQFIGRKRQPDNRGHLFASNPELAARESRDYESAEQLLERIRAARAEADSKERNGQSRKMSVPSKRTVRPSSLNRDFRLDAALNQTPCRIGTNIYSAGSGYSRHSI